MKAFITIFLCLTMVSLADAQGKRRGKHQSGYTGKFSYTAGIGFANYFGDICDGSNCLSPRPSIGLGMYYKLDNTFSIKTDLNYYRLGGSDVHEGRAANFRAGNMELFTSLMYSINALHMNYQHKNEFIPFVFGGLGVTHFRPSGQIDGQWEYLAPLNTEGVDYSQWSLIVPMGVGMKMHLSRHVDLMLEYAYRFTFTDYLDDVSSDRVQYAALPEEVQEYHQNNRNGVAIGQDGTFKNGNPGKNDGYSLVMFKVKYTFHPSSTKIYRRKNR